ncbi:11587_t:CDS:1, partial [Entrophospora sp. SA101]
EQDVKFALVTIPSSTIYKILKINNMRDAQAREQARRMGYGFCLFDFVSNTSFKSRYIPIQANALFDLFCSIDFADMD